ncbi:MAG: alpha-L-rhamnosidase C-terminal domain-containing protein [Tepidisphaeraceae bacterium]
MLGHALGWFHERLAGIRVDFAQAGPERLSVAPAITCGAMWVKSTRQTPFGEVRSAWRREGSTVTLELALPVEATLRAGRTQRTLRPGEHRVDIKLA